MSPGLLRRLSDEARRERRARQLSQRETATEGIAQPRHTSASPFRWQQ
jgi:hypothetical protein